MCPKSQFQQVASEFSIQVAFPTPAFGTLQISGHWTQNSDAWKFPNHGFQSVDMNSNIWSPAGFENWGSSTFFPGFDDSQVSGISTAELNNSDTSLFPTSTFQHLEASKFSRIPGRGLQNSGAFWSRKFKPFRIVFGVEWLENASEFSSSGVCNMRRAIPKSGRKLRRVRILVLEFKLLVIRARPNF